MSGAEVAEFREFGASHSSVELGMKLFPLLSCLRKTGDNIMAAEYSGRYVRSVRIGLGIVVVLVGSR
jgi:hypothetical protein